MKKFINIKRGPNFVGSARLSDVASFCPRTSSSGLNIFKKKCHSSFSRLFSFVFYSAKWLDSAFSHFVFKKNCETDKRKKCNKENKGKKSWKRFGTLLKKWINNISGEILDCPKINVKVHCQMLPVFARGPAVAAD